MREVMAQPSLTASLTAAAPEIPSSNLLPPLSFLSSHMQLQTRYTTSLQGSFYIFLMVHSGRNKKLHLMCVIASVLMLLPPVLDSPRSQVK